MCKDICIELCCMQGLHESISAQDACNVSEGCSDLSMLPPDRQA